MRKARNRAAAAIVVAAWATSAQALTGSWQTAGGGDWNDPLNWAGGIPGLAGDVARFGPSFPSSNATITLDVPVSLGELSIDGSRVITIDGSSTLTFAALASPAPAFINATAPGTSGPFHIVRPPVALIDDLVMSGNAGATLQLKGEVSGAGGITVQSGSFRLSGVNTYTGTTNITGGILSVNADSGDPSATLGDTLSGTIVSGGWLSINHGLAEPIQLNSGTLSLGIASLSSYTGLITMSGGTLVAQSGATVSGLLTLNGSNGRLIATAPGLGLTLSGGTAGVGDLRTGSDGSVTIATTGMAHQGDVVVGVAGGPTSRFFVNSSGNTFSGAAIINAGFLQLGPTGSLAGTGSIIVNPGAQLRVFTPAGASVAPQSVHLMGSNSVLSLMADVDPAGMLAPTVTGGVIGLVGVTSFTAGGSNVLDMTQFPAASALRLGASGSSIASGVVLKPDLTTRTLRFGAMPSVDGGENALHLYAAITDIDGSPTHLHFGEAGSTYLYAASTYTGTTTIDSGFVYALDPTALGSTSSATRVNGGLLEVSANGLEPLHIHRGLVRLREGVVPLAYQGSITMSGGTLTAASVFGGKTFIVAQPIALAGGSSTITVGNDTLSVGGVVGVGKLVLQPTQTLNINGPMDQIGDVVINAGSTNLDASGNLKGSLVLANGSVNVNVDVAFDAIRLVGGNLFVAAGKTVTAGEIELRQGQIDGQLAGVPELVKKGLTNVRLLNIGTTSQPNIDVQAGVLDVRGANGLGGAGGMVTISRPNSALAKFLPGLTIQSDFNLNDSSGYAYGGALAAHDATGLGQPVTIQGQVHLGSQGAYLGTIVGFGTELKLAGPISGGAMTVNAEGGAVRVTGDQNTYTGLTTVRTGDMILSHAGRLTSTAGIVLNNLSTLTLDNGPDTGSAPDRVGDAVPFLMNGGTLTLRGRSGAIATETIGPVTLTRGTSTLQVISDNNANPQVLTIGSLTRHVGATAVIGSHLGTGGINPPTVVLSTPPVLDDGIIGGWVTDGLGNFLTYGVNGAEVISYETSIATATPSSNVALGSGAMLTAPTNVNSLLINNSATGSLDLGGQTFNVESGGLALRQNVSSFSVGNGTLTAGGTTGGAELFIHAKSGVVVSANITDNPGGSVSLVKTGAASGTLSGSNTYSGTTFINGGALFINSLSSIPANNDVVVCGGTYVVNPGLGAGSIVLDSVRIDQSGAVSVSQRKLNAGRVDLTAGAIFAALEGTGTLTKTTDGVGTLATQSNNANFSGAISIEQGILAVENQDALGTGTTTVFTGGRLVMNTPTVTGKVVLAGGELSSANGSRTLQGNINVMADSTILLVEGLRTDGVGGRDVSVTGSISLQSGVALLVDGSSNLNVPGGIAFGSSSTLTLGSGANLSVGPSITVPAGAALGGDGRIIGSLFNNGTVAPGQGVGSLSMSLNYSQSAGASLEVQLAGTTPAVSHDQLVVNGLASLAGTLEVSAADGFVPLPGQSFDVIAYGFRTGDVTVVNQLGLPGLVLTKTLGDKALTLTASAVYAGDANLDGVVDITDLAALATHWQTSADWLGGDFDYSGFIDITDLAALATNWQAGVGAPLGMSFEQALASVGLGGVAVPEPVAGLALVAVLPLARSRRTHRRG